MNDLNVWAGSGRLTRDPELRQTPSGTSVCQLGLAVNASYKDGEEWKDRASFFDVVVWGRQGEVCARYLTKGARVTIGGRLEQRQWEAQDGTKRSKVEIIAETVIFPAQAQSGANQSPPAAPSGRDDFRDIDFAQDDDIPR